MRRPSWALLRRPASAARALRPKHPTPFRPQLERLEDLVLLSGNVAVPEYVRAAQPVISHQASSGAVSYLTPAQLRHAYGYDQITFSNGTVKGNGAGLTIAIVDAFDDPQIGTELATFDQQLGLQAPPHFTKVGLNASGQASTTAFPPPDSGWAGEIALDVEWAHAVAPGANILLVEANSDYFTDLLTAVNYARQQPGVVAVSMSWGGSEVSDEAADDGYFTTPSGHAGVTFFGASGDDGSPGIWPSMSTHVVSVGGTSLSADASGNYLGETGWSGSGGGVSPYLSQPTYQQGLVIHSGSSVISASGRRAGPDVSADADPYTGVLVYSSYGFGGWAVVGGTSASTPQWAGLMAIVDQGRALAGKGSLDGFTQTLPALYKLPGADFHDVTSGSNGGFSAGPGFDLVTGRGSPIANLVVRDLVAGTTSTSPPPTVASGAKVTAQGQTTANLSVLGADVAGESTLTYTWGTVGTQPGTVSFSANGTNGAKNTVATFGAAGTYTLQVTITDANGASVTSQVKVTLGQVLTSVAVSPGSVTVAPGASQQFTARALDQFGNAMAQQPAFTWSLSDPTRGTLSTAGLFKAGSATGSVSVQASTGGKTGTAAVTIGTSTVLFQDHFATGASNWTVTSGYNTYYLDYDDDGYRLLVDNNGGVSRIVAGQSSWSNYSYQATLNIDASSWGSASLLARVQDNNHLYFFGYNVGLGEWMIARRNGSATTILATSAPYNLTYNQDYTVRADVNGSSLKLYVGGVLQVSATDSSFATGKIGFTGTGAWAELDNVVVTSIVSAAVKTAAVPATSHVADQVFTAPSPSWYGGGQGGWYGGGQGGPSSWAWLAALEDLASRRHWFG